MEIIGSYCRAFKFANVQRRRFLIQPGPLLFASILSHAEVMQHPVILLGVASAKG